MASACPLDCPAQRYPPFPYGGGEESLFAKVIPIMLSAMVVIISWLAGRFIDKIDVSAPGSNSRGKVGSMGQSVKRSASHEKAADFHSSASRGLGRNSARNLDDVQELEGITATDDDENRLYHEQYGSEHSQEDGDRYDALGDSPGAQGVSSQGPRSPSVYSHFSQSVFSQSAYGPSAYGPSQRRLQAGSQYGHSQYDNASSASGSQYPGPVPSHFGASQMSESTSYHASGGGGGGGGAYGHGQGHGHASFGGGGNNFGVHGAPWGGRAAGSGGLGSGGIALRVPPPSYNPNAPRGSGGIDAGPGGVGMVGGRGGGGGGGGGGAAATAAAAASAAATAAAVMRDGGAGGGYNRGSPPPYSQAQARGSMGPVQASVLPNEPRPSLDAQPPRDVQDSSRAAQHSVAATAGGVVPSHALREASAVAGGGNGGGVGGGGGRGRGGRRFGPGGVGPQSGFGSDSEDGFSEVPSAFRP